MSVEMSLDAVSEKSLPGHVGVFDEDELPVAPSMVNVATDSDALAGGAGSDLELPAHAVGWAGARQAYPSANNGSDFAGDSSDAVNGWNCASMIVAEALLAEVDDKIHRHEEEHADKDLAAAPLDVTVPARYWEKVDATSNSVYYIDKETDETMWELPEGEQADVWCD